MPTKRENTITGRIWALAIASIGLEGIIATNTCMTLGASLTFTAASLAMESPIPGCTRPAIPKPIKIATAVVARYITTVFAPIRPNFLVSPRLVMPTTKEKNTTGTIIILIRLMNNVPIGAIHQLMKGNAGSPAIRPTITESTRAIKILMERFIISLPLQNNAYKCTSIYFYYKNFCKECLYITTMCIVYLIIFQFSAHSRCFPCRHRCSAGFAK